MASRTQIRGAPRVGAGALDEGDLTRAVVQSYSTLTQGQARDAGQDAAEAVLPARRALWALAERLIPTRLAAALRARTEAADPTGRDGVRELRLALADWLNPPPVCRWCRLPIRLPADEGRTCAAARSGARAALDVPARPTTVFERVVMGIEPESPRRRWTPHPRACRPSRVRKAPGAVAACGTLALYPAGYISLEVAAAALACPKGAARSYDVACDRDAHALTAAVADAPPRPTDPARASWADEGLRRLYAAVESAGGYDPTAPLPAALRAARESWRVTRGAHAVANGRAILGVQLRYGVPGGGVCRADLVQGGAIGNDRAVADYDATQARYTTYGAHWIRQGVGEARSDRDVVGTPEWVHALRSRVEDMLPGVDRRDILRALEALADSVAPDAPPAIRMLARTRAEDLVRLILPAEVRENISGTRPPRYVRRPLFTDQSDDAIDTHAFGVLRSAIGKGRSTAAAMAKRKAVSADMSATTTTTTAEDPERARERVAAWLTRRLHLPATTGPGLLAALRHGPPVFVPIGAGGDDGEDAQGTDGAGGAERQAAVLAAPDETEGLEREHDDRVRWRAALSALAALRATGTPDEAGSGAEMAEVVRRHHGLDSVAEDRGGATGESFASIAATPLVSTGRTLTREGIRKIYVRGLAALRGHLTSDADSSSALEQASLLDRVERPTRARGVLIRPHGSGLAEHLDRRDHEGIAGLSP